MSDVLLCFLCHVTSPNMEQCGHVHVIPVTKTHLNFSTRSGTRAFWLKHAHVPDQKKWLYERFYFWCLYGISISGSRVKISSLFLATCLTKMCIVVDLKWQIFAVLQGEAVCPEMSKCWI